MLFHKKSEKRYVSLNPEELRLLQTAMLHFRNKVIAAGMPADDINRILASIMK